MNWTDQLPWRGTSLDGSYIVDDDDDNGNMSALKC
jgi:hypothetical protein